MGQFLPKKTWSKSIEELGHCVDSVPLSAEEDRKSNLNHNLESFLMQHGGGGIGRSPLTRHLGEKQHSTSYLKALVMIFSLDKPSSLRFALHPMDRIGRMNKGFTKGHNVYNISVTVSFANGVVAYPCTRMSP